MPKLFSVAYAPALILSFVLGLAFVWLAKWHSKGKWFVDHANARSLHTGATPKVGGFGLLPAVATALAFQWVLSSKLRNPEAIPSQWAGLLGWLTCSALIFQVCLLNDRGSTELAARTRLFFYLLASLIFVASIWIFLPSAGAGDAMSTWSPALKMTGLGFAVLSILAFTNFFNFMDGMDGLAGSMGVTGFSTMGILALQAPQGPAGELAAACFCVAATCLSFLLWNWPKARVFMGDTGSTFLGFSAMALGWLGSAQGLWHWSMPFLAFFPFWFDASVTLLRRLTQGKKVWQAHREHFYQWAVLSQRSDDLATRHLRVLLPAILLMLASACSAIAQELGWQVFSWQIPWGSALILAGLHAGAATLITVRHKKLTRVS